VQAAGLNANQPESTFHQKIASPEIRTFSTERSCLNGIECR